MEQTQQTGLQRFNATITNVKTQDYLTSVLGEKKGQFVSNITSLVANNKLLQNCKPISVIYAGITATVLDLPLNPNLGFAYVIPYKDEATFQIGYKGLVQLAMRSGQFKTINVCEVREGELVGRDFISGECKFEFAEGREERPIIGYMAYFKLLNGFEKMTFWTKEKVEAHAKRFSQAYAAKRSTPWNTDYDAMAEKTVLKNLLLKFAPLSVEMQKAIISDQAVITDEQGSVKYVDNMQQVDEAQREKAKEMVKKMMGDDIEDTPYTEPEDDDSIDLPEDPTNNGMLL